MNSEEFDDRFQVEVPCAPPPLETAQEAEIIS